MLFPHSEANSRLVQYKGYILSQDYPLSCVKTKFQWISSDSFQLSLHLKRFVRPYSNILVRVDELLSTQRKKEREKQENKFTLKHIVCLNEGDRVRMD